MKILKYICLLMFFMLYASARSQTITYGSNSNEIMDLNRGNLFLIESGDEKFDEALKSSVKQYWKHNSTFKVVKKNDIENYLGDKNNYFIGLMIYGFGNTIILGDINKVEKQELVIFNGNKNKIANYTYGMLIATIPMMARKQEDYHAQTDYLVLSLNNVIDIVVNNSIEGLSGKVMYAVLKILRRESSILKAKTLLIDEALVDKKTLSKYKYKYKILPSAEIAKIMRTENKDYCALAWGMNPFKQIFIFDLETKKVIYGISTQGELGLNEKDFVKLNDIIDGKEVEKK